MAPKQKKGKSSAAALRDGASDDEGDVQAKEISSAVQQSASAAVPSRTSPTQGDQAIAMQVKNDEEIAKALTDSDHPVETEVVFAIPEFKGSIADLRMEVSSDEKNKKWSAGAELQQENSVSTYGSILLVKGKFFLTRGLTHSVRIYEAGRIFNTDDNPKTRKIYRTGSTNFFIAHALGKDDFIRQMQATSALKVILSKVSDLYDGPTEEFLYLRDMLRSWPSDHFEVYFYKIDHVSELRPKGGYTSMNPREVCSLAIRVSCLRHFTKFLLYFPSSGHIFNNLPPCKDMMEFLPTLGEALRDMVLRFLYDTINTVTSYVRKVDSGPRWVGLLLQNVKSEPIRASLMRIVTSEHMEHRLTELYGNDWVRREDVKGYLDASAAPTQLLERFELLHKDGDATTLKLLAGALLTILSKASLLLTSAEVEAVDRISALVDGDARQRILQLYMQKVAPFDSGYFSTLSSSELLQRVLRTLDFAIRSSSVDFMTKQRFCEAILSRLKMLLSSLGDEDFVIEVQRLRVVSHTALSADGASTSRKQINVGLASMLRCDLPSLLQRATILSTSELWPLWLVEAELGALERAAEEMIDPRSLWMKVKKQAAAEAVSQGGSHPGATVHLSMMRIALRRALQQAVAQESNDQFEEAILRCSGVPSLSRAVCRTVTQLMFNEPPRAFLRSIVAEEAKFPSWERFAECKAASDWSTAAMEAAQAIQDAVTSRRCTVGFVDQCCANRAQLALLENASQSPIVCFMEGRVLDDLEAFVQDTRNAWASVIDALQSMVTNVELIDACVRVALVQLNAECDALSNKPLCEWTTPDHIPEDLMKIADFWRNTNGSFLACQAYEEVVAEYMSTHVASSADANPLDIAGAIKLWVGLLGSTKERWASFVASTDNVPVATYSTRFGHALSMTERVLVAAAAGAAQPAASGIGVDQALSRQRTRDGSEKFRTELDSCIRSELMMAKKLLPACSTLSVDDAVLRLRNALLAMRDVDLITSAVTCCTELKVKLPATSPEQRFVALANVPTTTAAALAAIHHDICSQRYHLLQPPRSFFPALAVAVSNHIIDLFVSFPSAHTLSQAILDRTNGAEERDLEALNAFEAIHRAFSATEGVQIDFTQLINGRIANSEVFFRYMEEVSWCSDTLSLNASLLPRVWELLKDEVDQENAVSTALELSLPTTTFLISVKKHHHSVSLTATTEKRGADKPLTFSDLEDVCFQLTLAGTNADQSSADALAHYVHRYQTIKSAVKLCESLVAQGHPRFQEQVIRCEMSKTAEEISTGICLPLKSELDRWTEFKSRAETKHPLLSFLQPHELVTCLNAADKTSPDRPLLIATIMHALLPLTPVDDVRKAVHTAVAEVHQQGASITSQLKLIHRAIELAISTATEHIPRVAQHVAAHHAAALQRFDQLCTKQKLKDALMEDADSDVVLIQVPEADAALCSSFAISIFSVICGRSPLPFELLFCDEDTSHAAAFARRWGADHGSTVKFPLLFGVSGTQWLPPRCQADLLDTLMSRRKLSSSSTQHCKLFVVVADQGRDTLLSTQLRNTSTISASSELVHAGAEVCKYLCASLPIQTLMSEHPSSGKTQAAMRLAIQQRRRFASAIADGSTAGFVDQVMTVTEGRSSSDEAIVLHLSVSHGASGHRINDQLLEFAVLGRLTDNQNKTALRAAQDMVLVEIPSQGKLHTLFHAETPSLKWFQPLHVPNSIQLSIVRLADPPAGEEDKTTLHVVCVDDASTEQLRKGLLILAAFTQACQGRIQRLMPHENLASIALDDADAVTKLIRESSPKLFSPLVNFGSLVRYTRLLASMLKGVYEFPLYEASGALEEDDRASGDVLPESRAHNYRAMAFFLVKFSIECAEDLAATAVPPAADESTDESARLQHLELAFANMRRSFVMFTGDTYEFVTTSLNDVHLVTEFNNRWNRRGAELYDWDGDFNAMAVGIERDKPLSITQALRALLNDTGNVRLEEFRRVLPVLGLRANFGIRLLGALGAARSLPNQMPFDDAAARCRELCGGSDELRRVSEEWVKVIESSKATVADFCRMGEQWLQSLTASSKSKSPPFVLTADGFVRLLAVKTRLLCGIPVVFQGETGQGKTHLLRHLSRVAGTLFEVINVHRGVKAQSLLTQVNVIEAKLRVLLRTQKDPIAIVVLDEVNSMEDVWIAKSLVCDRLLLGRTVMPQMHFVCIMNPWRRQKAQITPGLDFVSPSASAGPSHPQNLPEHLAYDVHRSPESFMSVVWDFGLAHDSFETPATVQTHLWGERVAIPPGWNSITDEHIFAESCFSWHLQKMTEKPTFDDCWAQLRSVGDVNGNRHFKHMRTLLVILTDVAQKEMRRIGGVCSASLRDIDRVVSLFPFLYDVQVQYHVCHPTNPPNTGEPFRMLQRALSTSFVMNYLLRLPDALRVEVEDALLREWRNFRNQVDRSLHPDFMAVPHSLYADADSIAEKVCECLIIDEGMAVNSALKENVLSLFCSIMHPSGNLAQIIAGRPGSTKSASLDALVMSSDRACTDDRGRFFRYWKPIKKFVVQCTRETTAQAILRVARSAALHQRIRENTEPVQCVLVLEEVGIAVGSRHNPLMVLHSLIDRGVELDDGTVVRIPIVGISNYSLDAAKMNRMRITFRGNPRLDDLVTTARTLMRQQARKRQDMTRRGAEGAPAATESDDGWVDAFCTTFRDLILSDDADPPVKWFYGMRDFYSFVSMMKRHLDNLVGDEAGRHTMRRVFFSHLTWWALRINFGGHPDLAVGRNVHDAFVRAIFRTDDLPPSQAAWTTELHHADPVNALDSSAALCDMCARLLWYGERMRNIAFPLRPLLRGGQPCNMSNVTESARNVLAYALHRTPTEVARLYRVRNVLLFSRGNAGVELLFRLGFVKREDAEVIDPRDPMNVTPQQIMTDLSRVRRCLRTNKTLILVRASHLYEPMFDVLNQHFAIECRGEEYCFFSTLTVDGFTSAIRISPDHRIILVEDEANVSKLTSPFLNRCIKVHLDFQSALSAPQRRVFTRLKQEVEEFGEHIPKYLIPGYSDETLASHVLNMSVPIDATTNDIRRFAADALDWLYRVVCPRRFVQAKLGLVPAVPEEAIEKWDCNMGRSVEEVLQVQDDDDAEAAEGFDVVEAADVAGEPCNNTQPVQMNVQQHLLVLTEQREIHSGELCALAARVFSPAAMSPSHIVAVNFLGDDALDPLIVGGHASETTAQPSTNTFGIFVVDLSAVGDTVGSIKLDCLIHRVASRCPKGRHIVVIAVLASSARVEREPTMIPWCLTDRVDWSLMFVDEVTPPKEAPVARKHLYLDDDADLQSALKEAYVAVGSSRSRSVAQFLGSGENVKIIEESVRLLMNPSTPIFGYMRDMFVAGVIQLPSFQSSWYQQALRTVLVSDSLRDQVTTFLVNIAQRAAQLVIPILMDGNSHRHAGHNSDEMRGLFLHLLHSALVPDVDYALCLQSDLNLTPTSIAAGDETCRFPFSMRLEALFDALDSTEIRRARYQDFFGETTPSLEAVHCYTADLVERRTSLPSAACDCIATVLLLQVSSSDVTLVDVHTFLSENSSWMDNALEWARGMSTIRLKHTQAAATQLLERDEMERQQGLVNILIEACTSPDSGALQLSKVHAIKGLCQSACDRWELMLHGGVSPFACQLPAPVVRALLNCRDAEEVIEFISKNTTVGAWCRPLVDAILPSEDGQPEAVITLRRRLLDAAVHPGATIPFSVTGSALRAVIRKWRDLHGWTIDAFIGEAFLKAIHANPCSELSLVVSRCFFDVWQEPHQKNLQEKVCAALTNAAGAPAELGTFMRIAKSGIDTAVGWTSVCLLLAAASVPVENVKCDAKVRTLPSLRAYLGVSMRKDAPGHDQVGWYLCRAIYFQLLDLTRLREVLAADRSSDQPIMPDEFYALDFVGELTTSPPPLSVLELFDRFAITRANMEMGIHNASNTPQRTVTAAAVSLAVTAADAPTFGNVGLSEAQAYLLPRLRELFRGYAAAPEFVNAVLLVTTWADHHPYIYSAFEQDAPPQPVFERGHPPPERRSGIQHLAAQSIDLIVACLQALHRHGNETHADFSDSLRYVRDQIFTVRCPQCRVPFDAFTGCFAVTCVCGHEFCAWCFETSHNVHGHVVQCNINPTKGHVYGTALQWHNSNNQRRLRALREYLGRHEPHIQRFILGALIPDLNDLKIPIGSVHVQPDVHPSTHLQMLETVLSQLSKLLFGNVGIAQTVWWLCAKLSCASPMASWDDALARFELTEDPLEWITDIQNTVRDSASSPVQSSLLQLANFQHEIDTAPDDERRRDLKRHYFFRRCFDPVAVFWDLVNEDESFAVLRPLHTAALSRPRYLCAEQNGAYVRILHFIGKLQVACHQHHLTRRGAQRTTLLQFNEKHAFATSQEMKDLDNDVRNIWGCVERVFCKTKSDLVDGGVCPLIFDASEINVCSLLPGTDVNSTDGGFILALLHGRAEDPSQWQGLLEGSTTALHALRTYGVPQGPNANPRLFHLQACDLLEYREESVVQALLPLFVDPTSPSGAFVHDIGSIIDLIVAHPGVHGKPFLIPEAGHADAVIPAFKYIDEASSSVVSLNQRLPFESIPVDVELVIRQLMHDDAEFAEAAQSFIVVLVRELAALPARIRIPNLAESAFKAMATPLLPIQHRAAVALFSRLSGRLRTSQLVPLLSVVWDGKMSPNACAPLNNKDLESELQRAVKSLVAEERDLVVKKFLLVGRMACVMFLQPSSSFPPNFFDGSIMDLVMSVSDDSSFDALDALDQPYTLPHMRCVLDLVGQVLLDAQAEHEDEVRHHEAPSATPVVPKLTLPGLHSGFTLRSAVTNVGGVTSPINEVTSHPSTARSLATSPRPAPSSDRGSSRATWLVEPCLNYGDDL